MLEALRRHDPVTARSILTASTTALDAYPLMDPAARPFGQEAQEVLDELRRVLDLTEAEVRGTARGKVSDALFEEFKQLIFADRSRDTIVQRLGDRGALPLSAYKVSIVRAVKHEFHESLGFVRQAIASADIIDHVRFQSQSLFEAEVVQRYELPDLLPPLPERSGTTLFAKRLVPRKAGVPWVFIHASRRGKELIVNSVLRAYPEVVDIPAEVTPRTLLKALLDRYGVLFERPHLHPPTKLLEDFPVPVDHDQYFPVKLRQAKRASYVETGETQTFARKNDTMLDRDRRIMFGYAVDLTLYQQDQKRWS